MHPADRASAPRRKIKSQFLGHFLLGGGHLDGRSCRLVVLACVLKATTKNRPSTFFEEKSALPREILAMPMIATHYHHYIQ